MWDTQENGITGPLHPPPLAAGPSSLRTSCTRQHSSTRAPPPPHDLLSSSKRGPLWTIRFHPQRTHTGNREPLCLQVLWGAGGAVAVWRQQLSLRLCYPPLYPQHSCAAHSHTGPTKGRCCVYRHTIPTCPPQSGLHRVTKVDKNAHIAVGAENAPHPRR